MRMINFREANVLNCVSIIFLVFAYSLITGCDKKVSEAHVLLAAAYRDGFCVIVLNRDINSEVICLKIAEAETYLAKHDNAVFVIPKEGVK